MSGRDLPLAVLEGLRRAHCSHENAGEPRHGCAGELTVTPTGINKPVRMVHDIDPRTTTGRSASRALRQVAGEVGHEVRRQVERPFTALRNDLARIRADRAHERSADPYDIDGQCSDHAADQANRERQWREGHDL